jgi:urease subunit gamma/beta
LHLTPSEHERLLLAAAADLARRRLSRGAKLGASEAIALICDEICEMAWDGMAIDEIVATAPQLVRGEQLLEGVDSMVPSVQVDALFPHGTALVHVEWPFGRRHLSADPAVVGAMLPGGGEIPLAVGHDRRTLTIRNTGERAIWISSHYPLDELNRALVITEDPPRGYRLDLPAGESLRIGPGEQKIVQAVSFKANQPGRELNL